MLQGGISNLFSTNWLAPKAVTFGASSPASTVDLQPTEDIFVRQPQAEHDETLSLHGDVFQPDGSPDVPEDDDLMVLNSPDEVDGSDNDDEEDINYTEQFIKNTKPLEAIEPTTPVIENLRAKTASELKQILERPHINSVVLRYNDPRLEEGVLSKLQTELDTSLMVVDCQDIEPKREGSYFSKRNAEPQLNEAIEQALPRISQQSDRPLVLVLKNVNADELKNLQDSKVYEALQAKAPNVRFIISQPIEEEDDKGSSSWDSVNDQDSHKEWRAGSFQIVEVPALQPNEWAQVFLQDPFAQNVMSFYNLKADSSSLTAFFDVLKRENDNEPMTYKELLAELSVLGDQLKSAEPHTLDSKDIKAYSQNTLARRRNHLPTSGGPANAAPPPYDVINAGDINVRMDDIVGHDKAKEVLMQALEEAQYPELYAHLNEGDQDAGVNNVMLMGEPGGGKTMLAKALASEGGATFISTSGARFVNGLVGGGANAVRRLKDAIMETPDGLTVVFIDEMDALGTRDGLGGDIGASGSEDVKTINEFLAFTDGVTGMPGKRVLLLGATNRPEAIDPAILSRFNHKIEIKPLDRKQRALLLEKQMEQKNLHPDHSVSYKALSRMTRGFSGRDLRNMMKLAKLNKIRDLSTEEKRRLENDPEARKNFKLTISFEDLYKAYREVKKGWRQIETNSESGAYGGGNGGGRKMTVTL